MKTRIIESMSWYIERLSKGLCTYEETNKYWSELGDIVYEMWTHDLISDNVQKECFNALDELGREILKIHLSH